MPQGFGGRIPSIGPDKGHDIECLVFPPSFPVIHVKQFLDFGQGERVGFPLVYDIDTAIVGLDGGFLHPVGL